jgi:hypothetical protein
MSKSKRAKHQRYYSNLACWRSYLKWLEQGGGLNG